MCSREIVFQEFVGEMIRNVMYFSLQRGCSKLIKLLLVNSLRCNSDGVLPESNEDKETDWKKSS